jgi:hypothetical protein
VGRRRVVTADIGGSGTTGSVTVNVSTAIAALGMAYAMLVAIGLVYLLVVILVRLLPGARPLHLHLPMHIHNPCMDTIVASQ